MIIENLKWMGIKIVPSLAIPDNFMLFVDKDGNILKIVELVPDPNISLDIDPKV
jgi:hypothetical protein